MIIVTGSVVTKPETHDEAVRISIEHCKRSRTEPGCIAHNVHTDCANPNRLVFLEQWEDMAALKLHFKVPASQAFVQTLSEMAATPPEMNVFDVNDG